LNSDRFDFLDSIYLKNNQYRRTAYSPTNGNFAIAGNSRSLVIVEADSLNKSFQRHLLKSSADIIDIFYERDTLFAVAVTGEISKIVRGRLEKVLPKHSAGKATAACMTADGTLYVGFDNGKIYHSPIQIKVKKWHEMPYKGDTRIESMQIINDRSLLVSYANKLIHIYDLRYSNAPFYQPLVINNLSGKARALCVYDNFLYVTVSDGTIRRYDLDIDRMYETELLPHQGITTNVGKL
jgi:hypothetical protein